MKKLKNAVAPQEHGRVGAVVWLWQQAMLRLARILRRPLNKLQGNWYPRHSAEHRLQCLELQQLPEGGFYPQPDWLIDRDKLTHQRPVRARISGRSARFIPPASSPHIPIEAVRNIRP